MPTQEERYWEWRNNYIMYMPSHEFVSAKFSRPSTAALTRKFCNECAVGASGAGAHSHTQLMGDLTFCWPGPPGVLRNGLDPGLFVFLLLIRCLRLLLANCIESLNCSKHTENLDITGNAIHHKSLIIRWLLDFKTGAINHSATSPDAAGLVYTGHFAMLTGQIKLRS
ncbi:MAG: hypothetical protein WBM24_08555 [Candidatus Sulfotelmatobacter sp.]